jgi:hypothetical protein
MHRLGNNTKDIAQWGIYQKLPSNILVKRIIIEDEKAKKKARKDLKKK